jgi:hypothetical protein
MDNMQASCFIEEVIQGFYPRWKPQDFELRAWMRELRKYDYQKARKVITNLFFRLNTRTIDPPAGKLIDALRSDAAIPIQHPPTVMTSHFVKCIEGPQSNPKLKGAKRGVFAAEKGNQSDPDYMLRIAEIMRDKYEQLYGGKWIIVRQEITDDEGAVTGPEAKLKAEVDILTGPNCKTKRWLEEHKEKMFKTGELLKDVPALEDPYRGKRTKEQKQALIGG